MFKPERGVRQPEDRRAHRMGFTVSVTVRLEDCDLCGGPIPEGSVKYTAESGLQYCYLCAARGA